MPALFRGNQWNYTINSLQPWLPDTYQISATAYDRAGNSSEANASPTLSLDGVDDYLSLERLIGLNTGNPAHTVEAWIRVDNASGTKPWLLLLGSQGDGAHYWLAKDDETLRIVVWGGDERDFAFRRGEWNHIASVFDGTTLKIYLNGVLTETTPAHFDLRGISLNVGRSYLTHSFLRGMVRQISVWKTARQPEQILSDMKGNISGRETDLLCYWPINEENGQITPDLSPNGNPGQLLNGLQWISPSSISIGLFANLPK